MEAWDENTVRRSKLIGQISKRHRRVELIYGCIRRTSEGVCETTGRNEFYSTDRSLGEMIKVFIIVLLLNPASLIGLSLSLGRSNKK